MGLFAWSQFQPLCIEYFKLISSTAYSNSEKLFTRSIDLFSALISSIEYGLVSGSGSDIIRLSLECLIPICNYIFTAKLQLTEHGMCVRNQFKTVFDLIFKNSFEVDLFEIASNALYSLICCFQVSPISSFVTTLLDAVAKLDFVSFSLSLSLSSGHVHESSQRAGEPV